MSLLTFARDPFNLDKFKLNRKSQLSSSLRFCQASYKDFLWSMIQRNEVIIIQITSYTV